MAELEAVSYTHLTLPTNREVPEIGTNLPDQLFLTSRVRVTVPVTLKGVDRGDYLRGNNFLQGTLNTCTHNHRSLFQCKDRDIHVVLPLSSCLQPSYPVYAKTTGSPYMFHTF